MEGRLLLSCKSCLVWRFYPDEPQPHMMRSFHCLHTNIIASYEYSLGQNCRVMRPGHSIWHVVICMGCMLVNTRSPTCGNLFLRLKFFLFFVPCIYLILISRFGGTIVKVL